MTFLRLCIVAVSANLLCSGLANGQSMLDSIDSNVIIDGLASTIDSETGIVTYSGDVKVEFEDVQMRCASAYYNQVTGNVHATGGVLIWKAGTIYRGSTIDYNSITGEMTGNNVRSAVAAGTGNFFFDAKSFETETKLLEQIDAEDVTLTMHDVANPNFRIRSRSMTIYPDDKVEMHDIKYYAGRTPVFWFPFLALSLDQDSSFRFGPGYNSRWGAFMLTQYTAFHGDHTQAQYKVDLRSKRGLAFGVDFFSMRHSANRHNFGTLKFYAANDSSPNKSVTTSQRAIVDSKRYRLNFQHRIYLPGPDESTWYIDFDINKISDPHFYEDFFFADSILNPEPDNQISLIKTDDSFVATLMAKGQINHFYRTATRLPELSVDFTRRPIFGSNIQHQGSISAGLYTEKLSKYEQVELLRLQQIGSLGLTQVYVQGVGGSFATLAGLPASSTIGANEVNVGLQAIAQRLQEPGFTRFHTYHEFLYPKTFFGWLNLTPRVGLGGTSYHRVDGTTARLRNFTRGIFSAGLDASFKLTRSWSDYHNETFGLDGIRHVIQPYLNYSYLDAKRDADLRSIDRLSPTTRPRSIDVPLYTAIDDLRSWNVARVGVYNLFQTRRDYTSTDGAGGFIGQNALNNQGTYSWAGMNTYFDIFGKDPEYGRDLSNLTNELFWRPLPWLTITSTLQLPLAGGVGSFKDLNNSITFMPSKDISLTFGHQYLDGHPFFPGESSRIFSQIYARLTENWGFSTSHIYEADDGVFEFQSYGITRDLSSWVISLGAMVRDNRGGSPDFGVLLGFTLKELPQLNIDLNIDPTPGAAAGAGGTQ